MHQNHTILGCLRDVDAQKWSDNRVNDVLFDAHAWPSSPHRKEVTGQKEVSRAVERLHYVIYRRVILRTITLARSLPNFVNTSITVRLEGHVSSSPDRSEIDRDSSRSIKRRLSPTGQHRPLIFRSGRYEKTCLRKMTLSRSDERSGERLECSLFSDSRARRWRIRCPGILYSPVIRRLSAASSTLPCALALISQSEPPGDTGGGKRRARRDEARE